MFPRRCGGAPWRRRSSDALASNAYHMVALRSSTMDSLKPRPFATPTQRRPSHRQRCRQGRQGGVGVGNINMIGKKQQQGRILNGGDGSQDVVNLIEEKIPNCRTQDSPPERRRGIRRPYINAWELTEGLEDGVTTLNNHQRMRMHLH